jgi:hypothetical protein
MDDVSEDLKYLQKKYRRLYKTSDYYARGGLFNRKKRQQLLGLYGKSGRDRKKYDFWQDIRDYVRSGLIDFQLFNDASDDKDVDMVLNRESLKPVLHALLFPESLQEPPKKGTEKVKIAQLLVEIGLDYLGRMTNPLIPSMTTRVENAIDLSKELALMLLPENERESIIWSGRA